MILLDLLGYFYSNMNINNINIKNINIKNININNTIINKAVFYKTKFTKQNLSKTKPRNLFPQINLMIRKLTSLPREN